MATSTACPLFAVRALGENILRYLTSIMVKLFLGPRALGSERNDATIRRPIRLSSTSADLPSSIIPRLRCRRLSCTGRLHHSLIEGLEPLRRCCMLVGQSSLMTLGHQPTDKPATTSKPGRSLPRANAFAGDWNASPGYQDLRHERHPLEKSLGCNVSRLKMHVRDLAAPDLKSKCRVRDGSAATAD